ncbi:MAG TPA: cyclic nucleotide-binding domain-containing protein [Bryobacteraceae bacterium]|nr:cyclic nucleotide-binding domain-containing protein [Bryobacteraceae bacterium]
MRKALYFLGILNDSDIDWLMAAGNRREVSAGGTLIEEGRAIDSVYLVIDGAFSVRIKALGGREVARLMSGEVVGEMSFVDRTPPSATVQATEHSFVLDIPRRRLNAKLAEDAGFAARFYRALSMFLAERLRAANAALGGKTVADGADEVDFDALDDISVAGTRFDWIQRRLRTG